MWNLTKCHFIFYITILHRNEIVDWKFDAIFHFIWQIREKTHTHTTKLLSFFYQVICKRLRRSNNAFVTMVVCFRYNFILCHSILCKTIFVLLSKKQTQEFSGPLASAMALMYIVNLCVCAFVCLSVGFSFNFLKYIFHHHKKQLQYYFNENWNCTTTNAHATRVKAREKREN